MSCHSCWPSTQILPTTCGLDVLSLSIITSSLVVGRNDVPVGNSVGDGGIMIVVNGNGFLDGLLDLRSVGGIGCSRPGGNLTWIFASD